MTKLFIPVLLLLACCAMAQNSNNYERLSSSAINKSKVIQDLRSLGYEYVLQKALYVDNNKYNLPSNLYTLSKTESVERRISGRFTYYRYTVQLTPDGGSKIVRAIYTISFNQATGATKIVSSSYSILKNADGPMVADAPSYIDARNFVKGNSYAPEILKGVDFTVKKATKSGEIRKGIYRVDTLFSVSDSGFSYPLVYHFLLSITGNTGYTYRARISVPVFPDGTSQAEQNKFPITYTIYSNK